MRMDEALQEGLMALREYLDFLEEKNRELNAQLARARRVPEQQDQQEEATNAVKPEDGKKEDEDNWL